MHSLYTKVLLPLSAYSEKIGKLHKLLNIAFLHQLYYLPIVSATLGLCQANKFNVRMKHLVINYWYEFSEKFSLSKAHANSFKACKDVKIWEIYSSWALIILFTISFLVMLIGAKFTAVKWQQPAIQNLLIKKLLIKLIYCLFILISSKYCKTFRIIKLRRHIGR